MGNFDIDDYYHQIFNNNDYCANNILLYTILNIYII